jgi:hypothetical protein
VQTVVSGQPYQCCGLFVQHILVKKICVIGNFLLPFCLTIFKIQEVANQRILLRYSEQNNFRSEGVSQMFSAKIVLGVYPIINYPREALHSEIFHRFMRRDQHCVPYPSLSRTLREVFSFTRVATVKLFRAFRGCIWTWTSDKRKGLIKRDSSVSPRRVLGGCHGLATHSGRQGHHTAWPYRRLYSGVSCIHPAA